MEPLQGSDLMLSNDPIIDGTPSVFLTLWRISVKHKQSYIKL
jgi:hypothetical protein